MKAQKLRHIEFFRAPKAALEFFADPRTGSRAAIALGLAEYRSAYQTPLTVADLRQQTGWADSTARAVRRRLIDIGWLDERGQVALDDAARRAKGLVGGWLRVMREDVLAMSAREAVARASLREVSPAASGWVQAAGSWLGAKLYCSARSAQRLVQLMSRSGAVRVREAARGASTYLRLSTRSKRPAPPRPSRSAQRPEHVEARPQANAEELAAGLAAAMAALGAAPSPT